MMTQAKVMTRLLKDNCNVMILYYQCFVSSDIDLESPVVTCPANRTREPLVGQTGVTVNWETPNAIDNSGSIFLISTNPLPGTFTVGVHVVTVTAYDPSGNPGSCTFVVTVLGEFLDTPIVLEIRFIRLMKLGFENITFSCNFCCTPDIIYCPLKPMYSFGKCFVYLSCMSSKSPVNL